MQRSGFSNKTKKQNFVGIKTVQRKIAGKKSIVLPVHNIFNVTTKNVIDCLAIF